MSKVTIGDHELSREEVYRLRNAVHYALVVLELTQGYIEQSGLMVGVVAVQFDRDREILERLQKLLQRA